MRTNDVALKGKSAVHEDKQGTKKKMVTKVVAL